MSYHYFQCTVGFAARQVEFPPATAPVFSHCAVPCCQGRALLQARAAQHDPAVAARRLPCPGARGTLHVTGKCGTIGTGGAQRRAKPARLRRTKTHGTECFMNVFDIIGPVMIGPSSSHTAAPRGWGALPARCWASGLCGPTSFCTAALPKPTRPRQDKGHCGGRAGHGAGRRAHSRKPCPGADDGLAVSIAPGEIDGAHPNTARIAL